MRYLTIVVATAVFFAISYFSLALLLVPSPIAAEYWVREMLVIKKDQAKKFAGQRKLIVAAGSGALFSIDTKQLGEEFNIPALNLGLHAGLPLKTLLAVTGAIAESGDTVLLPLEPPYYSRSEPSLWQARNSMAWEYDDWRRLSLPERVESVALLAPYILVELVDARLRQVWFPESIEDRLATLDDEKILNKFAVAPVPTEFAYSAYHLDSLGNMLGTAGAEYFDTPSFSPEHKVTVSPEVSKTLHEFADKMAAKGVAIYFANTPFVEIPGLRKDKIMDASDYLAKQLSPFGPMLDTYSDLLFARKLFLNTQMHLNSEGRAIRTKRLADAIRDYPDLLSRLRR